MAKKVGLKKNDTTVAFEYGYTDNKVSQSDMVDIVIEEKRSNLQLEIDLLDTCMEEDQEKINSILASINKKNTKKYMQEYIDIFPDAKYVTNCVFGTTYLTDTLRWEASLTQRTGNGSAVNATVSCNKMMRTKAARAAIEITLQQHDIKKHKEKLLHEIEDLKKKSRAIKATISKKILESSPEGQAILLTLSKIKI